MQLKKQLKENVKSGNSRRAENLDDSIHEMNELIESDEELNGADVEITKSHQYNDDSDADGEEDEASAGEVSEVEVSFMSSDEEREIIKKKKEKEAKINNSFTGPYPVDPTDFNHKDKGANYQFEHIK